jgi:hypothetical protein
MIITTLLEQCRVDGVKLTPALDYEGPEAALAKGLEAKLKQHKHDVLRRLLGSAATDVRAGWFVSDWRFEWVQEVGLVCLRQRESADGEVKALFRELLNETPRTLEEWLVLGTMIRDAEADLRRAGKLPPVPNFSP